MILKTLRGSTRRRVLARVARPTQPDGLWSTLDAAAGRLLKVDADHGCKWNINVLASCFCCLINRPGVGRVANVLRGDRPRNADLNRCQTAC